VRLGALPPLRALIARRRFETLHELGGVNVEAGGDLQEVVEAEVALAALDLADEGPVQVGAVGEGFLAYAEAAPVALDALAEGAGGWGDGLGHGLHASPYVPSLHVQSRAVPCVYVP